jgi:hypothetical protein
VHRSSSNRRLQTSKVQVGYQDRIHRSTEISPFSCLA